MKKLFVCLLLCVGVTSLSIAQSEQEKEKALLAFQVKIHQLELYNMILPILMTKEQLRSILKVVEQSRQRIKDLVVTQYKAITELQSKVDQAIDDAVTKGAVPSADLVAQLYRASSNATMFRKAIADENVDAVVKIVTSTLNKGQIKAMANSLTPKEFPELLKNPDQVTDDDKVKIFVRAVLLDPGTYDVLVKMSI